MHRAIEETGVDIAQVARAYSIVRKVFDLPSLWADDRGARQPGPDRARSTPATRRSAGSSTARRAGWSTSASRSPTSRPRSSATGRSWPGSAPRCPDLLRGAERETLYGDAEQLVALGLPEELALRLAELLSAFLLLDVVEIAEATGHDPRDGGRAALRGVGAAQRRRAADRGHRAAPRRPLVDARARGRPARRLRRAVVDHHRRAAHDRRPAWASTSASTRGPTRTPSGWSGRARRCGRRWTATPSTSPPCRWRCGCCAACRADGVCRRRGQHGARRPARGPRPACRGRAGARPTPSATAATMASPRPLPASGAACRGRGVVVAGVADAERRPRRSSSSHATSRSPALRGVHDGVADQFAGHQHDVVDRVARSRRRR